jgi:imidazolonepropionase-like amidohydrolase
VITAGAVADLVLWKADTPGYPSDMRSLRPRVVILNGKLLDLDRPEPGGTFLGRSAP